MLSSGWRRAGFGAPRCWFHERRAHRASKLGQPGGARRHDRAPSRGFVVEQEVPIELELDGTDSECRHLLAFDSEGRPIGTARMQANGHIGRIAVVKSSRRRSVGSQLLEALVESAREAGLAPVDLDSQVHALGLYRSDERRAGKECRSRWSPHP